MEVVLYIHVPLLQFCYNVYPNEPLQEGHRTSRPNLKMCGFLTVSQPNINHIGG